MNRRVILVAVAACLLVAGAWYAFLWSPQSSEIRSARDHAATAEQQQKDLDLKLRGLQATQKKLPELKAQLDVLRAAMPDAPQLDNAIQTVQDAAKAAGVDLTTVTPAPLAAPVKPAPVVSAAANGTGSTTTTTPAAQAVPAPSAAVTEMKVNIAVTGTYLQVIDFVNRLNAAPRLVVVDALGLSGQADQNKNVKVITSIQSRFFVAPGGVK